MSVRQVCIASVLLRSRGATWWAGAEVHVHSDGRGSAMGCSTSCERQRPSSQATGTRCSLDGGGQQPVGYDTALPAETGEILRLIEGGRC
ncbi:hypothetical protein BDZ97DRAFT_1811927 [Flammula alnicola]|nr:hypothetical protein BDZ97DRAFT_1811927 [Flammula alnicola]